ncbi:MAG TPA: hypothetical protein VFG11_06965, partial [Acidobacteriota bacterium]|nr:hypothetical protein [Acidobacteriota bacterium]
MGDQVLALPALRYLCSTIGPSQIEIRLAGWDLRHGLFSRLLEYPVHILSLEDLNSGSGTSHSY